MEEVYDAVNALTDANIPIPPFLAGRWSLVADGVKALQCGLAIPTTKTSTSLERSDESG